PLQGIDPYVNTQTSGFIRQPSWPVTFASQYPVVGATLGTSTAFGGAGVPNMPDGNQNRPPRINQFSAGFQREVTRNFVVEADYVANRGAWLGGPYGYMSQLSPSFYSSLGLYPYPGTAPAGMTSAQYAASFRPSGVNCVGGNDCDRALLSLPLSSPAVQAKFAAAGFA